MGQIVGLNAKCKRANIRAIGKLGIPAAGEYILISTDNSMNESGQGNFDAYIVGDGVTAAGALELKSMADLIPTKGSMNSVSSDGVFTEIYLPIFGGDVNITPVATHSGFIYNGNIAGTNVGYWYSQSGFSSYIFDVTELSGQSIKVAGAYRSQSYIYIFCRDYATLPTSKSSYDEDPTKWTGNIISVVSARGSSGNNKYVNNNLAVPSLPEGAEHIYLVLVQYGSYEASASYTKESEYQKKLTFDGIPTEDSDNPVTSGGVKAALTSIENDVDSLQERVVDYDGSIGTDETVSSPYVTINDGIATKLINANGNQSNRGFWNAFTNGRSWIFDVTAEVGKSINITYWKRQNSRAYLFVPDVALIPSADPGAENWPSLYIKLGPKSTSISYVPETVTDTVPQPVTAAGDACEKVYLIVSGYWVGPESESNIVPKVVVPANARIAIPKKTSQLENDAGFVTLQDVEKYVDGDATIFGLNPNKVFLPKIKQMVHQHYNSTTPKWKNIPLLLAHFSDVHANGAALKRMLEWCAQYGDIADILHTGDAVSDKLADGMAFWDNAGAGKVLNIVGNHDASQGDSAATDIYNAIIAPYVSTWGVVQPSDAAANGYCHWYKDYPTNKIRLIGLDCMKNKAAQLTWLEEVLADALTNELTVVIAYHSGPAANGTFQRVKCNFNDSLESSGAYAYNWPAAEGKVAAFKESGGDFACWLCGHTHKDYVLWTNTNQLVIGIDAMTTGITGRTHAIRNGEKSQDLFNLIAIDTYRKTVKLLRVGCDMDDQMRKIDQCSIKYTTGEVL